MTTLDDRADDEAERERRERIADAEAQDAAQWEYESQTLLEYPTLENVEIPCRSRN